MNVSILMSEEEQKLAERYAKNHNLTLEEAFKSALFESIQDEYGIVIVNEVAECLKN